ncbi:LPXTG cell wall anchor domain-containing protein [Brevibacterium sp. FAM 27836]|uniref:LPXTG cell wall anchor domain-containing protein n=1 Tax=Brevibacterium sp. FAM 27836 TaxID=3446693 RepID=UPI003F50E785
MTHKSARARVSRARRISSPLAAGAAIATAAGLLGMGMSAPAFGAVDKTVDDAVFNWSVNDESTGGAYFGGCNFLIAGDAGDTGMARIWTADDAGKVYPVDADGNFTDGNTSIVKTNGKASNFADRCTDGEGNKVNSTINAEAANNHTGDSVQISNGTGTVDPDGDNASIQWEGSWSFAYYGGMTYWTISDPKLEVKNGKGTITGTYSGYGTDMDDLSKWLKLDPVEGDIVQIQQGSVDVTDDGFEFTPDYLGVETETDGRNVQSPKTAENESWWGAMPQDWIDFNVATGQDSYWYTTAGASTSIQPRKKTNPLTVEYTAQAPAPEVSTTHSVKSASAEDGLTVNVTGDGYDNLPDASTGKPSAGAYAAIVDRDLASKDVTAGNTTAVQYVMPPQIKDGSIDVDVTAKTAELDESKSYDVLTWVAHGLPTGDAELYREPLELTDEQKNALFPGDDDEDDGATDGAEAGDNGAADGVEGDTDGSESDDKGAADGAEAGSDGAEAGDDGAADAAEGSNDGAEGTDEGAADATEGDTDDKGAADGTEGDTDGAESDDKGAVDAAEGDNDGAGSADNGAAEGDSDGSKAAADADGKADGSDSDAEGSADGEDSDGASDGNEDTPAKPVVKDQTVGKDRLVKGTTTPNAEVNLAWAPVIEKNDESQVRAFAAAVPAEDNITVTADEQGDFSAKAPSAKGTYAYSAITTVDGVPSEPAEFTVTVTEDEVTDDDGSEGGSNAGATDDAGADDGATDGTEAGSDGSSGTADGAAGSSDSVAEGSSSVGADAGESSDGPKTGSDLPRTGADLMTLPIAIGLIVLGAGSVMFSRIRKR